MSRLGFGFEEGLVRTRTVDLRREKGACEAAVFGKRESNEGERYVLKVKQRLTERRLMAAAPT